MRAAHQPRLLSYIKAFRDSRTKLPVIFGGVHEGYQTLSVRFGSSISRRARLADDLRQCARLCCGQARERAGWFYFAGSRHIPDRSSKPSVGGPWERSTRLPSVGFLQARSRSPGRLPAWRSLPKLPGIISTSVSGRRSHGGGAIEALQFPHARA